MQVVKDNLPIDDAMVSEVEEATQANLLKSLHEVGDDEHIDVFDKKEAERRTSVFKKKRRNKNKRERMNKKRSRQNQKR
jgi:hypothetical protein